MAKITNELELNVANFIAGVKKALGIAADIPTDITVDVDANTKQAQTQLDNIGETVKSTPDKIDIEVGVVGTDKAETALGKLKEAAKGSLEQAKGGDIGGAFDGLTGAIGGALPQVAAVGAAVAAVGAAFTATYEKGVAFNKALKVAELQTGLTGEALKELDGQAKAAFQAGVGESAADAVKIVATLKQTLGEDIGVDQLGDLAAKATAVGSALGVEANELVSKAAPLIKQYGLTYDETLNLISSASQNGIADVGGYLDAINEFAPNAKEAGLSAEEFAGKLQIAGKAGIKDLAKVGDGYKELNNRIKSGDLATQVAAIGGPIGDQLGEIAKLAEQGQITAEEAAKKYTKTLDDAAKAGTISVEQQGKALTLAFGSIAEDIGTENTTLIFGAEIDEAKIKEAATKAGASIQKNIPPPSLGRIFEGIQTEIGQVFDFIYKAIIGPIIVPLLDGLNQIKAAFSEAFGGAGAGAGEILKEIGSIVSGVLGVAIKALIQPLKNVFEIGKAVFDGIRAAVDPVIKVFSDLFAGAGDGVDIFKVVSDAVEFLGDMFRKVLYVAIRLLLKPLEFIGFLLAKFYGTVIDVAKAVYNFATSFEPLNAAISAIVDKVVGAGKAIGDFISGIGSALGLVADEAPKAEKAVEGVGDATEETGEKAKTAAENLQALAKAFSDQQTAAATNVDLLLKAQAATGNYASQLRAATKELRKYEKALDEAALAGDPNRQRALSDAVKAQAAVTARASEELTAALIVNAEDRARALLSIQQRYDKEALDAQIKSQQALIDTGGAGVPEAIVALKDLKEQRSRLTKQSERDLLLLQGAEQTARFDKLIANEQLAVNALVAIQAEGIAKLQRNVDSFSFGDVDALVSANVDAIKASTDAAIRALVESTPEYGEAAKKIAHELETNLIDAEGAKRKYAELRKTITEGLQGQAGEGNPLGKQIVAILDGAERQARDTARSIRDSAKDAAVSLIRSDIVRGIEEQVRALEKQRDVLLENANLTREQIELINTGYAKAIDKVRNGALTGLQASIRGISDALLTATFDLNSEEATADLEAVKKANDEVIASFNAGKITYQEALSQLQIVTDAQASFLSSLGEAGKQALAQVAEAQKAITQESLNGIQELAKQREAVVNDTTLSDTQKTEQIAQINEKIATDQAKVLDQIGTQAGASFATLIASGENVGNALKSIAGDTAKSLLALYIPDILALFSSILPPPFGLLAGGAAVAALQALLSSALNGFKDGGPTGNHIGSNRIAGVVHGKEFVAPEKMYAKHGDLLHHLYAEKPLSAFPEIQDMLAKAGIGANAQVIIQAPQPSNSSINELASVRGELVAIRTQLQTMETLHKSSTGVVVSADEDSVIKTINKRRIKVGRR
ncbi:MAG: phage tail tape measure protein [Ignavibacteria bacterium]|nr:phage tail tape measure protein [Ignavibacteria bacterium]